MVIAIVGSKNGRQSRCHESEAAIYGRDILKCVVFFLLDLSSKPFTRIVHSLY
jgi:hypothetical protein